MVLLSSEKRLFSYEYTVDMNKQDWTPRANLTRDAQGHSVVFERMHELLRKFGGRGPEAGLSAREVDNIETQLPRQHRYRLIGQLVLGVTSSGEHELPGMCSESVEIELNSRILAQLMLHPVPGVRQRIFVRLLCQRLLHQLAFSDSSPAGKLVPGFGNPLL